MPNDMRDKIAEIIRNARMFADPLSQVGYAEADALIANGIIVPPCKVGQTVYIIDDSGDEDYVLDVKVNAIGQGKRGLWVSLDLPLGLRLDTYVFPNNWRKVVFPTKEEAEAKLKESESK